MVVYDARPSAFMQLSSTADWETFMTCANVDDGLNDPTSFVPSLDGSGRNAVISAGSALIRGQLWRCDAPVSTPIPAASAQNRIDRLVLRLNRGATTSPTVVQPTVITGTPGSTPAEPPIVQTPTGLWDLPVSSWTSTSAGALSNLVDERQLPVGAGGVTNDTTQIGPITPTTYTPITKQWTMFSDLVLPNVGYRLKSWGSAVWGSTQQTLAIRGNWAGGSGMGAVTIGALAFPASQQVNWIIETDFIVIATGTSGTWSANSRLSISVAAANLLPGTPANNAISGVGAGNGTINTTVPVTFNHQAQVGSATGSPTITCLGSSFGLIGP